MDHTDLQCRLCGGDDLESVLDLGATPPCESFLTEEQLDQPEVNYPLHLRICTACLLLQIPALVTPEDTFTEYAYFSSFSTTWVQHARVFVDAAAERLELGADSFVIEVASNDGYLLQHVVERGIPCLGIEPSVNVGAAAREKGIPVVTDFLTPESAARIVADRGPADLVVANNVYAHIPDLLGFTAGLRTLVKDDGWVSIEVHHALHLVDDAQFDTIYHEHFQYYTLLTAIRALATSDLMVVDAELIETHGGSIRVWARPAAVVTGHSSRVDAILELERSRGLHEIDGYRRLKPAAIAIKHALVKFLIDAAEQGKTVAGYGAPGKGNTLLNFCGIGPDLLPYTVDRNPYKHGRFTPGSRIPISPTERIDADKADIVLVLPWNLKTELEAQLSHISQWGGELWFPLPKLHKGELE